MRQLREILKLKLETGLSHREIAKACSMGAGTVSMHLKRAREAGLSWPLPEELDDAALEARLFGCPLLAGAARASPQWSALHQELKRPGVTLQLLWLEYLQGHPHGYRYSQFCELYRRWRGKLSPSMRQQHRPGEKLFEDFSGKRPHIVDRQTGELTAVELFVAVLGASSYTYAEALASQDLDNWIGVNIVELYRNNRRIASHRRLYGRGKASTKPEHMPAAHRAHAESTPSRLIHWAEKSAPATGELVAQILKRRRHPEQGYRACLGIMRLAKRYGDPRLEAACQRAIELRAYSYKTVNNILSSGFDQMPVNLAQDGPAGPDHDNIRGPHYYARNDPE